MQQQITALRTVAATDAIGGVAATAALPHPLLFHGTAAVVATCAIGAVAATAAFPLK